VDDSQLVALAAWGRPEVAGPLGGGHRNAVTEIRLDGVAACRSAWARLAGGQRAVVHGDPGPGNIRVAGDGAGLLDWDEARVDYTDLDLADLPGTYVPPERLAAARTAVIAWEAASGWIIEPEYARRQLALLRDRPRTDR
jgi:aminoglycoside phosphotransferase (APT) family kinase protein